MTTEIDNFEFEFNGTLIVLKIYFEDKAISWVGPEKKGVSKIFFLTFLTSDKHSMAKKSDRTHHSFSDPTLKRPSKDPIWSLREHKIGEHKSKVFQRSSRGIQDSREYVPPIIICGQIAFFQPPMCNNLLTL